MEKPRSTAFREKKFTFQEKGQTGNSLRKEMTANDAAN